MKIGSTPITDIKVGSTQITKVIKDGVIYWQVTTTTIAPTTTTAPTTTESPLMDVDGNVYTVVTIGTQKWMVENLKTTTYKDGTPIPTGLSEAQWAAEDGSAGHDGAFSWANNDIANKTPYGAQYNAFAGQNVHGLAPEGWSIPTISDIFYLLNTVGNTTAKLKEIGTTHWASPNIGATNESGWTGLPTGNGYNGGSPITPGVGSYLHKHYGLTGRVGVFIIYFVLEILYLERKQIKE